MPDESPVRTILRMRAREGCADAFEAAWRTAADEISRTPGSLRQELIRDAEDPRTFLIISDWRDQRALDAFGPSAAREQLTAALRDLRESGEKNTYEVLQTVVGQGPRIRVMVTVTVPPGEEAAYERAYLKVAERMRGTPGHVREELLREPGTGTYHILAEWLDETSFNAWTDDQAHLDQTAPLIQYICDNFQRATYHIVARPEESPQPAGVVVTPAAKPAVAPKPAAQPKPAERPRPNSAPVVERSAVDSYGTDVLVVGAGPAGLTAAIELARRGVSCRLVEKRPDAAGTADKAIGVQCRTMEIWETIGVAREAMDAGIWLHGQTVFVNGRQTHQVDWDLPDLPYAHVGLPQYETEAILTKCLAGHGVRVERGVELESFAQDADGVTAQLRHADGRAETVRTQYLVGCDGAHSTVRQALGLTFEGGMGMFPQLFMLGDVDLDWSMPEGHLLRFIQVEDDEMKGMLVCVPLKGRNRYRVATLAPPRLQAEIGSGAIPPGFSAEYDPPSLPDIQAVLDQLAPEGTTASNLRWASIFRIKHGIVDRYRDGRVFVAGDAAHLHPPAGGQGMNTGIHDAWNLGWKLALAVRGDAAPALLDSYEAERRPAGKAIVDRAVKIAFTDEMDMDDEREQFLLEMQMTLSYAGSPLVGADGDNFDGGPQPGDRAPDVRDLRRFGVGHAVRLFELTRGTGHTLLAYADGTTPAEEYAGFEKLAEKVRGFVDVYVVASHDAGPPAGLEVPVLRDPSGAFRAAYGLRGTGAYLIRPDGHVGFRTAPVSAAALDAHLAGIFALGGTA
ncbi:FAD-dependent oxidoreductase [Asanoa sp. WMMD1127]|uniref:FAD-dependent oxidoreductase n=1 Tax=Asanoa sp. WMMD1127 TaxID=3016107 RepID=UPI002415FEF6|nr:FAD-dependent oxidoreductase [Asanoa sp. WMMD1127]MDG4825459.1 FAD-dependent oxidoreductase [Asanoa sp. WMMD1127]